MSIAAVLEERRHILILDGFPYAAESDPAMLSSLQHAWDQHFKASQLVIILCGSHIHSSGTVHYAFFARAGFTEAAQAEAEGHPVTLVDLERLDTDLREAQEEVSL